MEEYEALAALHVSLVRRPRPEDIARLVLDALPGKLRFRQRRTLRRVANSTSRLRWTPAPNAHTLRLEQSEIVDETGRRRCPGDAEHRIRLLRAEGPTPEAFTLRRSFPALGSATVDGKPDWLCPA
ncbi:MAG: hypothetical protein QOI21_4036 [Actinomycetota bacterium]|nr:hypothetical protein [Actinomycetota bacterium]